MKDNDDSLWNNNLESTTNSFWNQYLTNDKEFAVFSQAAWHPKYRQAVARFGHRIIAVNKKEALEAQVIAKPETYESKQSGRFQIVKPVCPKGYSSVQEQMYADWYRAADQKQRFREGTVQCVHDRYMINEGKARQKYGFEREQGIKFLSNVSLFASAVETLMAPNVYKFKDSFSAFDLGFTGQVYYPATCTTVRKLDKFIDFGHPDFFFTEEPRKTMADMLKK